MQQGMLPPTVSLMRFSLKVYARFPVSALSALLWLSAGCGGARFLPDVPISAANVHEVERVFCAQMVHYSPLELLSDRPDGIENVAVDGASHLLYIHRHTWTGLRAFQDTGIYTIDLRTGGTLRRTRIPAGADLAGESITSGEPSVFDLSRGRAFLDYGGDSDVIVELNLKEDQPRMLMKGVAAFAQNPIAGDSRLAFQEDYWSPRTLVVVDTETGGVVGRYTAPLSDGMETSLVGATGDYLAGIRTSIEPHHRAKLCVYRVSAGGAEELNTLELPSGWEDIGNLLVPDAKLWAIRVRNRELDRFRLRIYEVPSLRLICELSPPLVDPHSRFAVLPKAGLLIVITDESLRLCDLYRGEPLREISLHVGGRLIEPYWIPVVDPAGLYVGAFDRQWGVQLFAVSP